MNWRTAVILVLGSTSCSISGVGGQYGRFYSGLGGWNLGGGGGYGFGSGYRNRPFSPSPFLPSSRLGGGGYYYNRGGYPSVNSVQNPFTGFKNQVATSMKKDDPLWAFLEARGAQGLFGTKTTTKGPNAAIGQPNVLQPNAGLLQVTPAGTTILATEATTMAAREDNFINDIDNSIEVDSPAITAVVVNTPPPAPQPQPVTAPQPVIAPQPVTAPRPVTVPQPVGGPQAVTAPQPVVQQPREQQPPPQQFQPNLRDLDVGPPPFQDNNQLGAIDPDLLEFLKPVPAVPGLPFQPVIDTANISPEQMEKVMRFLQFQPFILDPIPAVPDLAGA